MSKKKANARAKPRAKKPKVVGSPATSAGTRSRISDPLKGKAKG